ncbi:MAG: tetraacyldisaccharide 4'-kinase, partial [Deltaproteobacteria bacterium]|nr:tetraacyldisaccharide 4'-kinase [Deltaproteobacteria bacterium]
MPTLSLPSKPRLVALLCPFSRLYGAAAALRREVYRQGLLKPHKISLPVVSVGN